MGIEHRNRAAARLIDLTGQKFGFWTVLRRSETQARKPLWVCQCVCGTVKDVNGSNLRNGKTRSCGCQLPDLVSASRSVHGHGSRKRPDITYSSWLAMKERCGNPRHIRWSRYGGRGIQVCDEWRNSFETFLRDMGPRPSAKHSIDRIHADGHYEPSNCRWATPKQQGENTSRCRIVVFNGVPMNWSDATKATGMSRSAIEQRMKRGWSEYDALHTPPDQRRWRKVK